VVGRAAAAPFDWAQLAVSLARRTASPRSSRASWTARTAGPRHTARGLLNLAWLVASSPSSNGEERPAAGAGAQVQLRTPHTHGHAAATATLAQRAERDMRFSELDGCDACEGVMSSTRTRKGLQP
jgi:hypothetical protein